jgi:PKD repeat protein
VGAPISLVIHESLESYTIINGETIIVREAGTTTPIDCWTSFSHDDILTITPKQYLQANKTYEVVVVGNGIKDPVGNGIEPYTFTFSTGASITGGNAAPVITSFAASASPVAPNTAVTFTAAATDAENNTLAYRFNFGDGTASTAWGTATSVTHTYTTAGHFDAKLQVRETKPTGSTSVVSSLSRSRWTNTIAGHPAPTAFLDD